MKKPEFYILVVLTVSLFCGCSVPLNRPGDALPAGKQPILPGADPLTPTTPEQTVAGFPLSVSHRQNDTGATAQAARELIAHYDIAVLGQTSSIGEDVGYLNTLVDPPTTILRASPDVRPKGDRRMFSGHWLLYNGTRLTSDLPAIDGVTLVGVENPSVFSVTAPDFWQEDVMIYALDAYGRPDWSRSEEAVVVRVDQNNKMLTLKRAQYGSRPREFSAGRAVIAVHATRGSADGAGWVVNVSRTSPVSPAGLSGAQAMAKMIASDYRALEPAPTGVQLEPASWEVYPGLSNRHRGPDTDNNLRADWGYTSLPSIGQVNTWGLGLLQVLKHLEEGGTGFEGLSPDAAIWLGQGENGACRPIGGADGFAYEGIDKDAIDGFSAAYQRLGVYDSLCDKSSEVSYLLVTTPTRAFSRLDSPAHTNAPYRLGLGTALLRDMAFGYASAEVGNKSSLGWSRNYYLDEYNAGTLAKPHYLGRPLGPVVRLAGTLKKADLLNAAAESAGGWQTLSPVTISESDEGPRQAEGSVRLDWGSNQSVETSSDFGVTAQTAYTVVFWARAQNLYADIHQMYKDVPTAMQISLKDADCAPQTVLLTQQWSQVFVTFYAGKEAKDASKVVLTASDPGSVWFSDLQLRDGSADVMYRIFEGGLVLVNGSTYPVTLDMDMVAPGMRLKAIQGVQDPETNDGRPVGQSITLGALDARILIK